MKKQKKAFTQEQRLSMLKTLIEIRKDEKSKQMSNRVINLMYSK